MIKALIAEFSHLWSQHSFSDKTRRGFLWVMTGVSALILIIRLWLHGWQGGWDFVWISVILFFLIIYPVKPVLDFFYKLWMSLAVGLGFLVSNLILAVIFYLLITPVGWFMRIRGKDPLVKKTDSSKTTYWENPEIQKPEGWKRQW